MCGVRNVRERTTTTMWGAVGIVVRSMDKVCLISCRQIGIGSTVHLAKTDLLHEKNRPFRADIVTTVGKWLAFDLVFESMSVVLTYIVLIVLRLSYIEGIM